MNTSKKSKATVTGSAFQAVHSQQRPSPLSPPRLEPPPPLLSVAVLKRKLKGLGMEVEPRGEVGFSLLRPNGQVVSLEASDYAGALREAWAVCQ